MHILVINDDGPPSAEHSPYVRTLVAMLQSHGHVVSVCLPHTQRSWIGKAHMIGAKLTPSYLRPAPFVPVSSAAHDAAHPSHLQTGTTSATPLPATSAEEEWILVDGTPASCAQLGVFHLFGSRGHIDLVVSGPNFGRNSTAVYALSSGTIGGAMEAAQCGARAIALSWAYDSREHRPEALEAAGRQSVKVVEHLAANWADGVDVYNVNVPVRDDVEASRVVVTNCLRNTWGGSSAFRLADADAPEPSTEDAALKDKQAREEPGETAEGDGKHMRFEHRCYEWAPSHTAVRKSVAESAEGNDGYALTQGWTSVTPLRAAFMEAPGHTLGDLKMNTVSGSLAQRPGAKFQALVDYESAYVQPIITSALSSLFAPPTCTALPALTASSLPTLHIAAYEALDHERLLHEPQAYVANSYIYRKALIRKHHLPLTVAHYAAKHPDDPLRAHVPTTLDLEVDYAEFLDDALVDAWELKEAWARSEAKPAADREWWILKPGMSDQGQGIRLFSSEEELTAIFEGWEEEEDDDDDEEEEGDEPRGKGMLDGVTASHLRHFVVQPYLPPLLLAGCGSRKFHLRSYVLTLGALRVFVYAEMLALFAAAPYAPPDQGSDMAAHLTNTCLQVDGPSDAVRLLSQLPLRNTTAEALRDTIARCTGSLFRAAAAQPTHFQPLPNAFEIFGVDWLVDQDGKPWLLEVNAFPDFAMSGHEGKEVVEGVWRGALSRVGGLFGLSRDEKDGWIEVLDLDMGRR